MKVISEKKAYFKPESEVAANLGTEFYVMSPGSSQAKDAGDWETETEDDWSNPDGFDR
ncbi:MAG: hypothetical protein LUC49_04285 [Prevotella sp.]|nr:hypothetical protein [Prevotella sp.]